MEKRCSLVPFPGASPAENSWHWALEEPPPMGAKPAQGRDWSTRLQSTQQEGEQLVLVLQVGSGFIGPWSDPRGVNRYFLPLGFPLTRAPGRGRSCSHSFRLFQFLNSLRFPGDFALLVMQSWGQRPVLLFAVLMCEQKTPSWCSLHSRRPGLLQFSFPLLCQNLCTRLVTQSRRLCFSTS